MNEGTLVKWARHILAAQTQELEKALSKHLRSSSDGEGLHKIRTRARRLRCALEDLQHCTADVPKFLAKVKRLGDKTSKARDGQVLLHRLRHYRRIASRAERLEIDRMLESYRKKSKDWNRVAIGAIRDFTAPAELA